MSEFFNHSIEREIHQIYRPLHSPMVAPRKWWQYAIRSTILHNRQDAKFDIWKLVSEQNEIVLRQLYEDHPPPAIRMKKELLNLRYEVEILRRENETLRKMLADALEPSIKKTLSKSTVVPSEDNEVMFFENEEVVSPMTSHSHSAVELVNIEDEECTNPIPENNNSLVSMSTELYGGLGENSIESTALTHSPYEKLSNLLPVLSPAQETIVSYLQNLEKERKSNNETTSISSSNKESFKKSDLGKARERTTMIHKERILVRTIPACHLMIYAL